jgi:hypothetical protein
VFLVRKRSNGDTKKDPYALSYYLGSKVNHIKISVDQDGKYSAPSKYQEFKVYSFNTLLNDEIYMIEHHLPTFKFNHLHNS